jgi:hypothetical protein
MTQKADSLKAQAAAAASEARMLMKPMARGRGAGDHDQDQGDEMAGVSTAFSRIDRTVPDYGAHPGHLGAR